MSYRDDHDAALARIDALEAELGKNVDAKDRFASLEQQLATAKAERDRMRDALGKQGGSRVGAVLAAFVAFGVVAGGFAYAIHSGTRDAKHVETPVVAAPTPLSAHDAQIAHLMACVAKLDQAVAARSALDTGCVAAIRQQANDPTLGDDIHAVLQQWYAAESSLATSPDAIATRDALVTRIHDYVIPSYTR